MSEIIRVIGIDAAVQLKNTGVTIADYDTSKNTLEICKVGTLDNIQPDEQESESTKSEVLGIIDAIKKASDKVVLAIDAPLGYPQLFAEGMKDHIAGEGLRKKGKLVDKNEIDNLFRRYTDKFIYDKLQKLPLEVTADRIGRTAFATLQRLAKIQAEGKFESWEVKTTDSEIKEDVSVIEVYPAGTCQAIFNENILKEYKKGKSFDEKGQITDKGKTRSKILKKLLEPEEQNIYSKPINYDKFETHFLDKDDVLDSFICVLAGIDFIKKRVYLPKKEDKEQVKKEGWIFVRKNKDEK